MRGGCNSSSLTLAALLPLCNLCAGFSGFRLVKIQVSPGGGDIKLVT